MAGPRAVSPARQICRSERLRIGHHASPERSADEMRGVERTVTEETFDRDFWERHWAQALREHPDNVASRPPNAHLVAEIGDLAPGLALDAGCGHGADTIWLAASGWRVTAVDFSVTALEHARSMAEAVGADVAERIEWVEGDLGSWVPPPPAL